VPNLGADAPAIVIARCVTFGEAFPRPPRLGAWPKGRRLSYYLVLYIVYTLCYTAGMRIDGRTWTHEASETIRLFAVRRVKEGERPSAVMRSYGLCRTTIYKWLRAERRNGQAALRSRKAGGPPCKLAARRKQQVRHWICGKDPRQWGFDFGLWTRRIVADLIEEKFQTKLGLTAVGRLLAQLGSRLGNLCVGRMNGTRRPSSTGRRRNTHDCGNGPNNAVRTYSSWTRPAYVVMDLCREHGVPKGGRRWCGPAGSGSR
jgi:transposase